MHRGTSLVIQNAEGKYLLQFRDSGAPHDALQWDFFGGGMEEGESPFACSVRECLEELRLTITESELTAIAIEVIQGREEHLHLLTRRIEWGSVAVQEGAGCGYFTKEEILLLPASERMLFLVRTHL